ncbi:hypothetical protein D9M71_612520 [compost metagenome]
MRGEVFEGEVQPFVELDRVFRADVLFGFDVIDLGQFGLRLGQAPRPAAVVGDQHQAGGVEVQAPGDVQLVLVRLMDQIEHGRVLRIPGGADASGGLVQHEMAQGFTGLQHLVVDFDAAEFADFAVRVADDFSVNPDAFFHQQQAHLLTVEARQVAEETVDTHDLRIGKDRGAHLT